jgi:phosphoserine phosphatase
LRTIIRGGIIVDKSLMTASFMEISRTLNGHLFPGRQYVQKKQTVFRHGFYLIQTEVIDELADRAGVAGESDHGIGMNEDFSESFKQRMALLFEEDAENGFRKSHHHQGAHRLMKALKYYGFKTAILSGGFTYLGSIYKKNWGRSR